MSNGFLYTTPAPTQTPGFEDINQSIQVRNARFQRAIERDQAIKNAQQVQQARELANAKKIAATNAARADGYDSSKLIPPLRPLFNEYRQQKLEETNYFTADTAVVEQALDDIQNWYVKHTAHTQDESVVGLHDQLFELDSDPGKRNDYAKEKSPISQLNIDINKFAEREMYYRGGFATDYRLGENGVVYALPAGGDQGEMPIYEMDAWTNASIYDPMQFLGSKATKTMLEIATGVVQEAATTLEKTYDANKALEKSTSLIKLNKTDDGLVTRMRIIEDYFSDAMLGNTQLVNEYIANERNNEGNFIGESTKTYQEAIFRYESEAIQDLVRLAAFEGKRQDDESGNNTNGLTLQEVEAEVFDSTPSAFRQISGDPSMMFGNVDALRRGEDMAFAEHYTLERFTKDRVKVDIENPLYVPQVNAAGEEVYPDIDPVIQITPTDLAIAPTGDGKYQVVINNISVDGSPYSMAILDGEQDIDVIKKIDFYLKDSYDGHMSIDKLVERAYQKYNALEQAQQQGAQGAPPAQTGRPDTSRY
jgi:hypothetical protein